MSKENGFAPIRRGLWEHVRDGRMSPLEALAFIYVCSQADTRTGVWKGSAGALVTELGFHPRTARDLLERMEHSGYIRRFVSQGMRHCYPILVHKFPVTQGEHNGEVLDALSSTKQDGCLELQYISCEVHGEVHGEVDASQRRIKNRKKRIEKENPAPKPAALVDPRHKLAFDSCYESYRLKFGVAPTWGGREAKTLQRFLQEHPKISADEITNRYKNFLASTEHYHAQKHGSLLHLLSNFDIFTDGPIHEHTASKEGGINRAEQRDHNNLRAAGFLQ